MAAVLDTCAWIWLASDPGRLSPAATEAATRARSEGRLYVPAICAWEVAKLVEKGRLALRFPVREWVDDALRLEGLQLYSLTPSVCVASTQLPRPFHGDPADQLIVATARDLGLAVITSDRKIRDYAHVAAIW